MGRLICRAKAVVMTAGVTVIGCLGAVSVAWGAGVFYVDGANSACSNSGSGTAATPYCTISAAASAQGGAGTTLYVKPAVYHEQVTVPASGASGSPFVFQALGAPVVVDGADDFSLTGKWTLYSGDVWLASGVTWSPKQVFADGARLTASSASVGSLPARSFRYVSGTGLYVNAGGGNPGSHQTLVGRRTYGFRLSGRSWVTIDGFTVTRSEDRAIYLSSSSNNNTITRNTATFANSYGIAISGSSGVLIGSNVISDNTSHGVYMGSSTTGATIQDNDSFRNGKPGGGADGIMVYSASGNAVLRNRSHGNQGTGLEFRSSANNNLSIENLSWNNGDHGYDHVGAAGTHHVGDVAWGNTNDGFAIQSTSTNTAIFNSITANNGLTTNGFDLWVDSGSVTGFVSHDNIIWNSSSAAPIKYISTLYSTVAAFTAATGQDTRSIQADPRFLNPGSGDFRLLAGSPAIDSADSSVANWPATDAAGRARVDDPATPNTGVGSLLYGDRGALEFQPPHAALTVTPASGVAPLAVTADASASGDVDGTIVSYLFAFGDGTVVGPQTGATAAHTYAAGTWAASVTVTDDAGGKGTASQVVVAQPPQATNQAPNGAIDSPTSGFINLVADPSLVLTIPQVPKPSYLTPFLEPTFGTTVTRIANDPAVTFTTPTGDGTWGADARHHYSKDQPWNADGTLIAIQNSASPTQLILDGETYQLKYAKCANYSTRGDRWHPSRQHPYERISVNDAELAWFDVVNCVKTRAWALPFIVDDFGSGEGNTSADGRFVAFGDATRAFVVDMDPQPPLAAYPSQRIGPPLDVSACGLPSGCAINWVSVSASGKYVVVFYSGAHPRVFDVNPDTLALTPHPMLDASPRCAGDPAQGYLYDLGHADLALNPFDGNEDVMVGQEQCGYRGELVNGVLMGGVVMARLRDGAVTSLTDPTNEAYPHHISARNSDRLGWVYVGYRPTSGARFSDEIVAVKLDGSQAVQRFAHKHSVFDGCYRCESHAVPSRDGRRVIWASNWADNCGAVCGATSEIQDYVVDARSGTDVEITAGQSVYFAGTGTDPDGNVPLTSRWNFGGGAADQSVEDPGSVAFNTPGTYTVTFTVTDSLGLSDPTPDSRVIVVNPPGQGPAASLTITPSTGNAPLGVTADASASTDPGGVIVSYRFDFGDGTVVGPQTAPTATHVYAAGNWTATVTVADTRGASGSTALPVTVAAVGSGSNLIGNPSFEIDTAGWATSSGATIQRTAGGFDGAFCAQVTGPASTATIELKDDPNWVAATPAAGTHYRVTAWVRSAGSTGTARLRVREYLNGVKQGTTASSAGVVLSPSWQMLSVDYVAASVGSTLDLQITDTPLTVGETFQADNFWFWVVP
ncbi:MAG: PKD domain-containing protein [Nitrospirae bacterium]|nr:PKD domain-containing protein [Nitrospirota bacterium]